MVTKKINCYEVWLNKVMLHRGHNQLRWLRASQDIEKALKEQKEAFSLHSDVKTDVKKDISTNTETFLTKTQFTCKKL